jgi:Predicted permeases
MAGLAFVGSLGGAATASSLPEDVFRPVIVALLIVAWVWVAVSPSMGSVDRLRYSGRRHVIIAGAAGAVIGFYDGLLGPGTGSFLLIVLVGLLGYSFLSASVTAKIVNLGTNIAAIIIFGFGGYIWWQVGLVMARLQCDRRRGGCADGTAPRQRFRARGVLGGGGDLDRSVGARRVVVRYSDYSPVGKACDGAPHCTAVRALLCAPATAKARSAPSVPAAMSA